MITFDKGINLLDKNMFTGIIEQLGQVQKIENQQENIHLWIKSPFKSELKIDQSVAHNGVCLTVVDFTADLYKVTAIKETLKVTNLSLLQNKDYINLERCLKIGDRLDGHMVQGHVDQTASCVSILEQEGSWLITFRFDHPKFPLIDKGSICINGTSLTVVNPTANEFSVAIIPYTFEHTIFKFLKIKDIVNIEFDIIGKYAIKYAEQNKF